jgi:hypothetical protein
MTQAAEKIIEDNELAKHGFHIEELAWMKEKDKALGKFASLGIWFDSAEGAEYILQNGFIANQHYIPHVERREIKYLASVSPPVGHCYTTLSIWYGSRSEVVGHVGNRWHAYWRQ